MLQSHVQSKPEHGKTFRKVFRFVAVFLVTTGAVMAINWAATQDSRYNGVEKRMLQSLGKEQSVLVHRDGAKKAEPKKKASTKAKKSKPTFKQTAQHILKQLSIVKKMKTIGAVTFAHGIDQVRVSGIPKGGIGSATNSGVRDQVQLEAPPSLVAVMVKIPIAESLNNCFVWIAPNPKPLGDQRWDAGHILGRQNGGTGTDIMNLFPQNPQVNRGNSFKGVPTRQYWRGPEDEMKTKLQGMKPGYTATMLVKFFSPSVYSYPDDLTNWAPPPDLLKEDDLVKFCQGNV